MKRIITLIICILLILGTYLNFNNITNYIIDFFTKERAVYIPSSNKYAKNINYSYVQITDNFIPYSYQDLLNIFYTSFDHGYDKIIFHCPNEYETCIDDIKDISNEDNKIVLTTISNYVSAFNNFKSLTVEPSGKSGDISITINYLYTEDEINYINNKVDELWNKLVTSNMSKKDIIKVFHDYIINNTVYDQEYEDQLEGINNGTITSTKYPSNKAIGPLKYGYAICSGYTDLMSIILDRLGYKNIKVTSDNHIWNAAFIDEKWLHIDLTWDDPVSDYGINTLLHKFYLIDTKTIESFDLNDHHFDKSIYVELK